MYRSHDGAMLPSELKSSNGYMRKETINESRTLNDVDHQHDRNLSTGFPSPTNGKGYSAYVGLRISSDMNL